MRKINTPPPKKKKEIEKNIFIMFGKQSTVEFRKQNSLRQRNPNFIFENANGFPQKRQHCQ